MRLVILVVLGFISGGFYLYYEKENRARANLFFGVLIGIALSIAVLSPPV